MGQGDSVANGAVCTACRQSHWNRTARLRLAGASAAVKNASWIERASVGAIPQSIAAWDLGAGESAVLALGALSLGLDVIGTLGVVIAAHRRGVIESPKRFRCSGSAGDACWGN